MLVLTVVLRVLREHNSWIELRQVAEIIGLVALLTALHSHSHLLHLLLRDDLLGGARASTGLRGHRPAQKESLDERICGIGGSLIRFLAYDDVFRVQGVTCWSKY